MDLLPLLLMFGLLGLMMFFMSRRQRRAQAQQAQLQDSLSIGDRVMTTSGLYGTVVDTSSDSTIGIELAPGVETEWLRAAVREKVNPEVAEDDDDDEVVDEVEDDEELVNNEPPPVKDDSADAEDVKQK